MDTPLAQLETQLNSFDPTDRVVALAEILDGVARGEVELLPLSGRVNMHCHTFFSYNAYGHSPASLAWLAKKNGYAAMGIVDFDVLDGVTEFLTGCEMAGVRGSAGIETRVFVPEFATREINSPGEPGVYYHMGIGFASGHIPEEAAPIARSLRERAERRNRTMLARLNAHLAPLEIDYDAHVLPLTPAGNATERHMLQAIIAAAEDRFPSGSDRVNFWSTKLDVIAEQVETALASYARFSNLIRGKLMKKGGTGYVVPTPESFPTVDEFHRFIVACGALPCAAWLDGTSAGEQAIEELLGLLVDKGVAALNIIPERNWNLPPSDERNRKIHNLHEIGRIAAELDLPLNVGTEMNSPGNPLIDDFAAVPLAPLRGAFLAGAYFIYGHTVLQRTCGLGYQSEWARAHLPARKQRNAFYEAVGRYAEPGSAAHALCVTFEGIMEPDDILARLKDA